MAPDTLAKIKVDLRIGHDKLDDSITDSITGCLTDLRIHGIVYKDDTDPLILSAVQLWCHAAFVDDTARSAEFQKRYNALRDCLKAAEGYGWTEATDE